MRRLLFALLFFGYTSISFAQILSIDKAHLDKDTSNYLAGAIDLSFLLNNLSSTPQQENVYIGFFSKLDLVYLSKKHAFLSITNFRYFKPGQGAFINSGVTHFNVNWFRRNKVTFETFVQFQYDQSRNLKERHLLGGGTRINLLRGKNSLHLGLGGFYEIEEWQDLDATIIKKAIPKLNVYLGGDVDINEHVNINSIAYYQVGYDDEDSLWRNRVNFHLELRDKLSKKLTLNFALDLHYENEPIIPIPKLTYNMRIGVGINFNRI